MTDRVTALILAGGRARRMGGVDKRELVVEGRTIFERQCEVLAPRVAEIVVSSARSIPGHRSIADTVVDGGPLAGIAAGLAAVATPWLLVVAGDMPDITGALVDAMLAAARDDLDAVGVEVDGRPEPLVALYRVAGCRAVVEARLAAGQLKASQVLTDAGLRVVWVEGAWAAVANINRPEDLQGRK